MATVTDYLTQLQTDKQTLVDNLVAKGIDATSDETFTSLVPKVADISNSSTVTKGIVINSIDENGYVTDVSLVGMTEIPNYYFSSLFIENTDTNTYLFGNIGVNLHLPDDITKIGSYAFNYCKGLALTKLPSEITSIGQYAFSNCSNLALTELPSRITRIEINTFYQCKNLALTKLPDGLTHLGDNCFYTCTNLAIKEVPAGITIIPASGFSTCTSLTELTCLGAITTISRYGFSSCSNLTKLVLPNVTEVPSLANANAFNSTPIANGTGYVYVPDDLVDSFKTASTWSTFADQIKPISELEVSA